MTEPDFEWPPIEVFHTLVFDFDGVFTDNKVYVTEEGREVVRCDRADGLGVALLRRALRMRGASLDIFIVSTERNPVVATRARKLGLACHQGVADKLGFLHRYFRNHRPEDPAPEAGLLYVGNDLNDLPLMRYARLSVVPEDAHPLVKRVAHAVVARKGGEGFVRAVIEQLLGLDRLTLSEILMLVRVHSERPEEP